MPKRDILDRVHATEINWQDRVPDILRAPARYGIPQQFVYLIAEADGPFKIGWATDLCVPPRGTRAARLA